ncbi:hypothetical protein DFJ74DRAFT_674996 [Hyaloraphidium curvatum]|nr:hypothetical protein DFJ74DRAFT_674996 [Hyaloraphidium curvatum]
MPSLEEVHDAGDVHLQAFLFHPQPRVLRLHVPRARLRSLSPCPQLRHLRLHWGHPPGNLALDLPLHDLAGPPLPHLVLELSVALLPLVLPGILVHQLVVCQPQRLPHHARELPVSVLLDRPESLLDPGSDRLPRPAVLVARGSPLVGLQLGTQRLCRRLGHGGNLGCALGLLGGGPSCSRTARTWLGGDGGRVPLVRTRDDHARARGMRRAGVVAGNGGLFASRAFLARLELLDRRLLNGTSPTASTTTTAKVHVPSGILVTRTSETNLDIRAPIRGPALGRRLVGDVLLGVG